MLKKQINKNNQGFTIIEVMIVLAIAGLILLVVFLAVPALQRNARNTARKTDVQAMLGGISDYATNNDGQLPITASQGGTNPVYAILGTAGTNTVTQVNLGFYTKGVVTTTPASGDVYLNTSPGATISGLTNTEDYLEIVEGAVCAAGGGATTAGATSRSYVALYIVETGGAVSPVCQAS